MGTLIEISTPDGPAEAWLTGEDGRPGVLFYVDAIGLRPRTQEMADRIASWGYVVLAPNVFHRDGRAADLAPVADLREPGNREEFFTGAMARVGALTPDLSNPDARLWVEALLGHAGGDRIGVTGYCMGARLALRAAALFPENVVAAAGFHGGGLVTEAADSPHRLAAESARAEFVFGHADHDRSMPPEAVGRLGEALATAGLLFINDVYAGAPHGYTMNDTPAYHEESAERHYRALESLLGRTLG